MQQEEYSAGLVSQSFWLKEMKIVTNLLLEGISKKEIKAECIKNNLFGVSKEYRANRIFGYIWNRIEGLEPELRELFVQSDVETQKIINLIAIIKKDRLFFEFLMEVYNEKILLGSTTLEKSDVNIFFKNKELQSKEIERWNDKTKKRLSSIYINYMTDANLLLKKGSEIVITSPILDVDLEKYLKQSGQTLLMKAITGVSQ